MKKKQILQFTGLYGDNFDSKDSIFVYIEPLEKRSKKYDWEIEEHLHNELFQMFVLKEGQGEMLSENQKYNLIAPSLIFIPPNTLHGFTFQNDVIGQVLTFSESYFDGLFSKNLNAAQYFNKLEIFDFNEQNENFNQVNFIISQIITEFFDENLDKNLALQLWFQLLFLELKRKNQIKEDEIQFSNNRSLAYFQKFNRNVRKFSNSKSIDFYAQDLGITAVHLNRICREIVQKSALQIVNEYIEKEARKYLQQTSYDIAEIAFLLNFNDAAYFTKAFKKWTGFNPSDYRKK